MYSPLTKKLIDALRWLPGIGPKSAQRMAFQLLSESGRSKGIELSETLKEAMNNIQECVKCRNFCEQPVCHLCNNPKRSHNTLCVVETPADLQALEQTRSFSGLYFVLHGHLSPLEGIGPDNLGLHILFERLENNGIEELVLATNSTMEGEATAQYIAAIVKNPNTQVTRIAHGVPIGGELEYLDGGTLGHAFTTRTPITTEN
jgi:recombination protein RecR